jgi:glycosyltransferase involved in cell wall biosynthesis
VSGAKTVGAGAAEPPVDLSIVITTRNEEKYLPVLLESVRGQRTDLATELIVVDNASTDTTVAVAEAAGALVLPHAEVGDVPGMRNLGLAHARGTAVLFADADVAFSPNYLEEMVRPILDGVLDVTLCLRHNVLEARFHVVPAAYSKSYVWFLLHLPEWCLTKIPVRVVPWLTAWLGAMLRRRCWIPPATIPDRVNTPALVARTGVVRAAGGWRGRFGTHEDTAFCRDLFAITDRVAWRTRPMLFISQRRDFPTDARWLPQLVLRPFLELVGLAGLGAKRVQDENGYKNPAGRR